MSKLAALKNVSAELYRKVLLDTIRRLWSSYKNMETVRELLHVAFPSDKAEIDRFLAETGHTIESLHEVSESAPKVASLRTQAMPALPIVDWKPGDRVRATKDINYGSSDKDRAAGKGPLRAGTEGTVVDVYPAITGKYLRGMTIEWGNYKDPGNPPGGGISYFLQGGKAPDLEKIGSQRYVKAGVAELWNGFVNWIRGFVGAAIEIDQTLDTAIAALDKVGGEPVQASMRHVSTNKRADILEVMGSKEALTNPTLLQLFAALFKLQPIAIGEMKGISADLYAREVQIPRIPEDVRPQVMATINRTAIKPEVQEAMQLLVAMQKANKALSAKIAEVQAQFGGNESLRKAVPKATETVLKYVAKLTNKQRRFEDALFRATTRVKRGAVDYKTVIETLRTAATAANDEILVKKIDELLAAGTRAAENIPDLEIIMDEVPADAREQLRAIEGPATPVTALRTQASRTVKTASKYEGRLDYGDTDKTGEGEGPVSGIERVVVEATSPEEAKKKVIEIMNRDFSPGAKVTVQKLFNSGPNNTARDR